MDKTEWPQYAGGNMTLQKNQKNSVELRLFLKDTEQLFAVPTARKYENLVLPEYPFDAQLLSLSELYRRSRKFYAKMGGQFSPKLCSVPRSLSSQDLFGAYVEYSPLLSEWIWFLRQHHEIANPGQAAEALQSYNGISLYHEQNHRIVWESLPPAPGEKIELCRYLNFAESLVITLDLALADQIGKKLSPAFERRKAIYRTGGEDSWSQKSKSEYRTYLCAVFCATYFLLEMYHPDDIPQGLEQLFPNRKKMIRDVMKRSLDLSELFLRTTNQVWQERYWAVAHGKLSEMHHGSDLDPLYLPEDPLALGKDEFQLVEKLLVKFGL